LPDGSPRRERNPKSPAISDDAGLFALEPAMPFQMTDPELRRWLLVLHQVKAMRATMRMRPAS